MAGEAVSIKGTRQGLIIIVDPEEDFNEIKTHLIQKMEKAGGFFKGAQFSIHHESTRLISRQAEELQEICRNYGLVLNPELTWSFGQSEQPAKPRQGQKLPPAGLERPRDGEAAALVRQTLRSGQAVTHEGHVVILGDLNPGAVVQAAGHILLLGKCAGTAHAGCRGDRGAIIVARSFNPVRLTIAGITAQAREMSKPGEGLLQMARLGEHGGIIIENYDQREPLLSSTKKTNLINET